MKKQLLCTKRTFDLCTGSEVPDLRSLKYISDTDNLSCPICQQPYVRPMTTFCGHTFCHDCILQCLTMAGGDSTEGFCPLDRTPLNAANVHDLFPTPFIITNMVDDLKVYCLNAERGCDWRGCRWEVQTHSVSECGYTGVRCNLVRELSRDKNGGKIHREKTGERTHRGKDGEGASVGEGVDGLQRVEGSDAEDGENGEIENGEIENGEGGEGEGEVMEGICEEREDGEQREDEQRQDKEGESETETNSELLLNPDFTCSILTERRFLSGASSCVHQPYECALCSVIICTVTQEAHLATECERNYVTCSLCQNDAIPRKSLDKHESNCRRSGKFPCPAHDIGCNWVGTNLPAYEIHAKEGNCALNSLHPYLKRMEASISDLAAENSHLQKQIHQILGNIVQGKIANLGYSEPVEEIGSSRDDLQRQLKHLTYEMDLYKSELDEKITPFIERESRKSTEKEGVLNGLVNDNFMMRDELNLQRKVVANLRKQVQYLTFKNRGGFMPSPTSIHESDGVDVTRSSSEERLNLKL